MRKWINLVEQNNYTISLGRVYHGSRNEFSIIDPSRARAGLGAYATPNRAFAEEFGPYVIEGELMANRVIDLMDYGPFVDEDHLGEIAYDLNMNEGIMRTTYEALLKGHPDVFMFNLLEQSGFRLTPGLVVEFEDWGSGAGEPAFVFSDPAQFVLSGPSTK